MNRTRILSLLSEKREFVTYCLIGLSGVGLDLLAFTTLITVFSVHHQAANAIAYSFGTTNNFFLNLRFNFRNRDRLVSRFLSFQAVGVLGLVTSAGALWILVDQMRVNPILSKLGTLFLVVLLQYNLNRLVSFRKRGAN
jgi:putative flippase GtrA